MDGATNVKLLKAGAWRSHKLHSDHPKIGILHVSQLHGLVHDTLASKRSILRAAGIGRSPGGARVATKCFLCEFEFPQMFLGTSCLPLHPFGKWTKSIQITGSVTSLMASAIETLHISVECHHGRGWAEPWCATQQCCQGSTLSDPNSQTGLKICLNGFTWEDYGRCICMLKQNHSCSRSNSDRLCAGGSVFEFPPHR